MTDSQLTPYGVLLLRVSTGVLFLAHGLLKVLVFTPAGTAAYFESLGLPGFLGYATIGAEVLGGLALILGIHTRIVSAALIPILIGSILFAHGDKGWVFSNPGGGWEFPAFWIAVQSALVLTGDGPFALRPDRRA